MLDPNNVFSDLVPASDPGFTGYIPGTPKPKEPKAPVFVPQGAKQMFDPNTNTYVAVPQVPGDDSKDILSDAIKNLGIDELVTNVDTAKKLVDNGYATGVTGAVLSRLPGTDARDFRATLEAIKGGIILEKMQALKEASKTGASGLGALSEKEGDRLAASVAALDPRMSDEALRSSLNAIQQHANFLRAVSDGKDPRDPNVAKAYGLGNVPPAIDPGAGGGEPSPGLNQLNDEQKQAYAAFVQSHGGKPSGDQVRTFLKGLLGVEDVPNADAIAEALAKGRGFSTTTEDLTYQQKIRQRIEGENKLGINDSPTESLSAQGRTLNLSDEAAGVGNALANIIMSPGEGKFDPVGAYRLGRDVERQRIEDARQQLGYGGTAIELASGLASAGPGALEALAPRAAAKAAGTAGAAGGALAGFGAAEGAQESASAASVGALSGYALGRYAPAAIERVIPRRFRGPQGMAPELADAAQAEGVDLIRPMVDPSVISDYGALESNVYSQPIIRGAAGRVRGQIEDRVGRLSEGAPLEEGAAGEKLQIASNRYIQRSRGIKDRLYKRAEDLGGDTRFVPEKALTQVDDEIAQLSGNPETNAAEIAFLQKVRADLANGQGKTVAEIRNIREGLRGEIGRQNLTLSGAEARALRVMDAAADDIAAKVPQAASAYKRADTFYRERMVMVDDIKRAILGKKGDPLDPQKAFANIKTLASPGANGRRLAAVMRNLESGERQDIAATIAQSLGRRAVDEPFSTALFLSQARKLSPSARRTIFGPDGAQSIDNLRLLSRKLEEAEKDINRSRSATVLERQGIRTAARAFISGLAGIGGTAATGSVSGGIAGVAVAGGAMGASAARRVLSARAMVNPRVSRWLAEAADVSTPQQAKEATRKLSVIIAREPALANELKPVYDFLENRLDLPLAAQPEQAPENNDE